MILRLTCEEGFCYHGWQRVVAELIKTDKLGEQSMTVSINVSRTLAELYNATSLVSEEMIDNTRLRYDDESMFVLSGESFTLADFATTFESLLGDQFEITYIDGDEDES